MLIKREVMNVLTMLVSIVAVTVFTTDRQAEDWRYFADFAWKLVAVYLVLVAAQYLVWDRWRERRQRAA